MSYLGKTPSELALLLGVGDHYIDQSPSPIAPDKYVFLLDAISIAGRVRNGDGWKGWETATKNYPTWVPEKPNRPKWPKLSMPPKSTPLSLNKNGSSASQTETSESFDRRLNNWRTQHDEKKKAALEKYQRDIKLIDKWTAEAPRHSEGVEAINAAFNSIMSGIINAKITPYLRPVEGGACFEAKLDVFMAEGLALTSGRNGRMKSAEGAEYFIFLHRAEFEGAFTSMQSEETPRGSEINGVYLTPYMRVMWNISKRLNLREGESINVESLKAEIKDTAERLGLTVGKNQQLSERNMGVMATFLREPSKK